MSTQDAVDLVVLGMGATAEGTVRPQRRAIEEGIVRAGVGGAQDFLREIEWRLGDLKGQDVIGTQDELRSGRGP
jgi:hypothetical protein